MFLYGPLGSSLDLLFYAVVSFSLFLFVSRVCTCFWLLESLNLLFYVVVPFSLFYSFPEFALDLALGVA